MQLPKLVSTMLQGVMKFFKSVRDGWFFQGSSFNHSYQLARDALVRETWALTIQRQSTPASRLPKLNKLIQANEAKIAQYEKQLGDQPSNADATSPPEWVQQQTPAPKGFFSLWWLTFFDPVPVLAPNSTKVEHPDVHHSQPRTKLA